MTADFSLDVMIGMLRKGQTGDQILDILNVIVPDQNDSVDEQIFNEVQYTELEDADAMVAA